MNFSELLIKLKKGAQFTLERAKEPSTWTAVGALAALAHYDPAAISQVGMAAPVVASLLLGVFLPEKGAAE